MFIQFPRRCLGLGRRRRGIGRVAIAVVVIYEAEILVAAVIVPAFWTAQRVRCEMSLDANFRERERAGRIDRYVVLVGC